MNFEARRDCEVRVLLAAPTRRDGDVTRSLLNKAGLACVVCDGLGELAQEAEAGAGAILLTEEAMTAPRINNLLNTLAKQPAWSELPVVLLLHGGVLSPAATKVLRSLRNVTLLERPAPIRSVVSAVQAAIRGRERQYQIRDQIESIRRAEATSSELRKQLEIAIDASELGTFHCKVPLGRIEWNEQCKSHFWLPAGAEIDFDLFYSILHPDDRERTRQAVEACVYGGSDYDIEYRAVSPRGEVRWIRATGRTTYDEHRQPVQFDGTTRDVTERRRLEMENESRLLAARSLAAIVESSDDAIISKSLDGIIQSWNVAAERIFGYSAEQAVGHHISLVIPAERADEEERIIAELKAGQRVEHFETVRIRSDGQPVQVSLTISPIKDESGRVIGASKIARDISGKRRAEERERMLLAQAASANAKFQAFFEQSAVFAGIMDIDGKLIEANRLSWEGCGFTKQQIIGKPFWDGPWWTPSSTLVDQIKAASAQAASGQVFRAEMPYYVADGSERIADVTIQPIKDETDRVLFLAPTGADITDRRRAEEDRRSFVAVIENSTDFIGMCDPNGTPFFINRAGLKMVGLRDIDEARQHAVWDFFFPEDHGLIRDEFFPAVLKDGHGEIEVRFRHFKTGEALWMVYKVVTLTDGLGQTIGFATVSQEITERRQLEEHLRKMAADLSEANHRKDEFLATLAHELRNPLAPIRNSLHLLRLSGELSPSLDPVREIMERQVDQMVRLIDDLLDVSRISHGKIELQRETIELATIISTAVETARPLIDAAGHQFALSLPAEPVLLDADPVRIAQTIGNLLNNAAKYTKPGGQIWLSVRKDGNEAAISIRDTGLGIPADMLPLVFDMFAQVDRTLTRAQGGLGIGLTLAKIFIEMHGGRIEAHSDGPDKGSEFVVHLPMLHGLERRPAFKSSMPDSQRSATRRRILIVDDTRAAGYVLGKLLETMGQQVCTAHNAATALESARRERPDLVISDIGMPGMDGYELARRLRREPGLEGLILVALTGYGQDRDKQRAKASGFDYHLVKPVGLKALQDLLASLPTSADAVSREQIQQRRAPR
jgi:PAS domain S-box-containing protein